MPTIKFLVVLIEMPLAACATSATVVQQTPAAIACESALSGNLHARYNSV
jgi:hypothetical protein